MQLGKRSQGRRGVRNRRSRIGSRLRPGLADIGSSRKLTDTVPRYIAHMADKSTDTTDLIAEAVGHALVGDLSGAAETARQIDPDERWAEKRSTRRAAVAAARASEIPTRIVKGQEGRNVAAETRLAVFARDHYICRYAHCGRRTLDERVFAALSRLIPDSLPYHQHWAKSKAHPLCWTHLASFEHVVPWSAGGDHSEENLVTTCSLCNYSKMELTVEQLGWTLRPAPGASEVWDGLSGSLEGLVALDQSAAPGLSSPAARSRSPRSSAGGQGEVIGAAEVEVGNLVALVLPGNSTRLQYRVVARTPSSAGVVQVWRSAGRWQESARVREVALDATGAADRAERPEGGDLIDE